jgi:predicted RNA-binding protein with PUA-like domain
LKYWLMKSEPDEFSIDDLGKSPRKTAPWTGVRNYQARNFMLRDMRVGDGVLFYHSSCPEPGIAGIAEVASAPYPDPSQFDAKSPVPRSEIEARRSALVARGREAREEDAAPLARRDAHGAGARGHGDAAARQSPLDHAGHCGAVEGGVEVAAVPEPAARPPSLDHLRRARRFRRVFLRASSASAADR